MMRMKSMDHRRSRLGHGLVILLALAPLAGCLINTGSGYRRDLAPTMDRMIAAYEDLASRKFRVLADFESPEQGTLFHVEPPGAAGAVEISTDRARSETGVGALRMALGSSAQRLVAVETPEAAWALVRNWSDYHLLIFSVFSPRPLSGFSLSIASGTENPLTYVHSHVFLNQGWNLVRLDLADVGEQVNLGDVRQIQFWCEPLESPVDLFLDDLVLVDNARTVFGPAEPQPGDLYVRSQGRRIVAGAADRFEVIFARGRIRQWFDLGRDPQRVSNLAGPASLGPLPVVIPAEASAAISADDMAQWAGLGPGVEVFQTLADSLPLRVVIQAECRFGSADARANDKSPYHHWRYTIYADGRIYVECSGTARTETFRPPGVGIAFGCDGSLGFTRQIAGESRSGDPLVLFSRAGAGESDLLVVPAQALACRALDGPGAARLGAVWTLPDAADVFSFAGMIRVWPADIDSPEHASPMAADYRHPVPLGVDAGRLVLTDPGDVNNDGFSEMRGYYVLQLDGSIAKVRIDGRQRIRFSPVFKVVDVSDRDVWVYLDGRQIRHIERDADGNVLFELPGVLTREALLEITSRAKEPAP